METIWEYRKANPELIGAFSKVHPIGTKTETLSTKDKDLIALGISVSVKCEGCIVMHTNDALQNDASSNEIIETIGTAIYIGGGPSNIYGAKEFKMLKEFEEVKEEEHIINY